MNILFLSNETSSKVIVFFSTVSELLLWTHFRFPHLHLTVSKISSIFFSNHHGKFIDGKFCGGSVMTPVVVISSANWVEFIRVFLFYKFLSKCLSDSCMEYVWIFDFFCFHVTSPIIFRHLWCCFIFNILL